MLALNTKGINLSRIYSLKALKYGLYQRLTTYLSVFYSTTMTLYPSWMWNCLIANTVASLELKHVCSSSSYSVFVVVVVFDWYRWIVFAGTSSSMSSRSSSFWAGINYHVSDNWFILTHCRTPNTMKMNHCDWESNWVRMVWYGMENRKEENIWVNHYRESEHNMGG